MRFSGLSMRVEYLRSLSREKSLCGGTKVQGHAGRDGWALGYGDDAALFFLWVRFLRPIVGPALVG